MNETRAGMDLTGLLRRSQELQPPGPQATDWLTPVRERGAAAVMEQPLPGRKDEAWRYTSLSFLEQAEYVPFSEEAFAALQLEDIEELLLEGQQGDRLVFVNGRLAPALCALSHKSRGVLISALGGGFGEVPAALQRQLGRVAEQRHVFSALNAALMTDGALIQVPAGVQLQAPIEILHVAVGLEDPGICHPRHLIVLEEEARAEVIERYCSLGKATYFTNAAVEVALGSGSELVHARLQEESPNAQHLSDLQVRLDEGSRYRLVQPSLGGAWARNDVRVTFAGQQAEAELDGLLLAGDRQLNDVHLDIRHEVPGCTSRETFKGILDGKGRVVFDGRILVAKDAQKTDAQLANDNLMLSRAAEVDTKPQLEIFADDVKCSHGTTVGEIDGDMLFYLQSRGIPQARAVQMLCQGFAQEVLDRLPGEGLRARATRLLAARLAETAQPMDGEA
jgi:Fe-S cluster assembly protein SufD